MNEGASNKKHYHRSDRCSDEVSIGESEGISPAVCPPGPRTLSSFHNFEE